VLPPYEESFRFFEQRSLAPYCGQSFCTEELQQQRAHGAPHAASDAGELSHS
jgi:hypothetical protein